MKASIKLTVLSLGLIILGCKELPDSKLDLDIGKIENGLITTATVNNKNGEFSIYERMEYYGVPGVSIAVIEKDTVRIKKGYGVRNVELKDSIDSNTMFQAASVSKPLTCLAILKMVEANLIALDSDVNMYLRDWKIDYSNYKDSTKVTLRQLLSHKSGLTVGGFQGYKNHDSLPDLISILNGTNPANNDMVKLKFEPGTDWSYSGGGYVVIQKLIEDVSGKGYPDVMDSLVLKPLKMNSSFFNPAFEDKSKNVAVGYNYDKSKVDNGWRFYPELAAAGLWTNPSDILKFIKAIGDSLNEKPNSYLTDESAKIMLDLGFFVDDKENPTVFSFRGTNKGYRCEFIGFTENDNCNGAMVMTNSYASRYLIQEILRSIASHYDWRYPFAKEIVEFTQDIDNDNLINYFEGQYQYAESKYIISLKPSDSLLLMNRHWNGNFSYLTQISDSIFIDTSTLSEYKFAFNQESNNVTLIINNKREYRKIR
ncbi:serine hydrolase [Flagellimonas sp. CMM7]|uniref:serine hydrolase domain-containing protein n=1 Tax=Flagellimonas sp. CMM7 TaxID=2654676 RepID=UPI0013D1D371|nr:serine hydrolase domain-containing protein [Flagellimonas sp. CMM7]UII81003.1 beta-lactamase family protein [Flagellimonas sp. CMM7]